MSQERDDLSSGEVEDLLPVFRDRLAAGLSFPMSWLSGRFSEFEGWKQNARETLTRCLLKTPPDAPFAPEVVSEEDRGSYRAQRLLLSITGYSRVPVYLLIPKGKGPFPAVLLLHDHGAWFDIGKEKVIRPWQVTDSRQASAREWVDLYYGGRFIGDELAGRGYVCFAADMLNWGDRGGAGDDGQQALAANLFLLGTSFSGLIAHEDRRAAEFLSGHPDVDPARIAAMGLSVGGYRTWQLAGCSDLIGAGCSICWMTTIRGQMVPGDNQTLGQSSYTMLHPGLSNSLDYPDVASLACPKPMLFYGGRRDPLFTVPSMEEAYAKMRRVWNSQGAGQRLVTRLWDVPHEFSLAMQVEAVAWLDAVWSS